MRINAKETQLIVWAKNGEKVAFLLSENPKIKFSETDIIITSKDMIVTYSLENMLRFTYENEINTSVINVNDNLLKFDGEVLLFPNLKVNSNIAVYTLVGKVVFSKTTDVNGDFLFPVSYLEAGVYIVNVNGIIYKILKK
jgi:hypothetical protein